jgi:hypothetical protein
MIAFASLRQPGHALATLPRGPWSVFLAIADAWSRNDVAPRQHQIASFAGCTDRAVRRHLRTLVEARVIAVDYEPGPTGGRTLVYSEGPRLLEPSAGHADRQSSRKNDADIPSAWTIDADLVSGRTGRDPDIPSAWTTHEPLRSQAFTALPHEADTRSGSVLKKNNKLIDSSLILKSVVQPDNSDREPAAAPESPLPSFLPSPPPSPVAHAGLVALFRRKHPGRPLPRRFDPGELDLVAQCVEDADWEEPVDAETQADAVAGAFLLSKDRAPTVKFIWGNVDHFLAHVARGRKLRRAPSVAPPRPKPKTDEAPASLEERLASIARIRAVLDAPSSRFNQPQPTRRPS